MIVSTAQELSMKTGTTTATGKHDAAVSGACRLWLGAIGDLLIPAGEHMPSASEVDVSTTQLDVVLNARPDLIEDLNTAWARAAGLPPQMALDHLRTTYPVLYQSLCLIVAGGYYAHSDVLKRLGYTGQQPRTVQAGVDIDEDLLERVIERGPRFRQA
ncbi:hypothetical protein [Mycolicibacterium brisbanense]|uniref:Uncharacterized protein n=1 Tax=Mycolicibacterium brisbanense TaxID=146020 RepID=A0A124DZS9_9MYCO|nr:hypothetical protein [Mycolicibacterium brisbanense]MCV7161928.1 hypothetical protein [Mycolicibacterium brisbanense]GAS88338.1 uncharacterized protein RMCB_2434 [Mycolicibacterium brisbanense]